MYSGHFEITHETFCTTWNYFAAFLLPGSQGFTHQIIFALIYLSQKPRGYILKTKFALRAKKKKDFFFRKSPKKRPDNRGPDNQGPDNRGPDNRGTDNRGSPVVKAFWLK